MTSRIRMFVAMFAAVLIPGIAVADAIDGNWCSKDGRHFEISGPQIVTWGGTRTNGDYDRHGFRYVVPGAERGAGAKVEMWLMGDEAVQVKVGGAEPETWSRCPKPTS